MYIRIENCSPDTYANSTDKLEALDNLLSSHAKRTNLIYAKDEITTKILSSHSVYGIKTRKYAQDLQRYRRDIGSMKNTVDIQFIADFNQSDINSFFVDRTSVPTKVTCSYKLFIRTDFLKGPILLCENRLDCNFYSLIGSLFIEDNSCITNTSITCDFKSGGGSQTYVEYRNIVNQSNFGLCILDNDKAHQSSGLGSTAAKFKPQNNDVGLYNITESLTLNVREIESLIPINIIQTIINNDLNNQVNIDAFSRFQELEAQDPVNFRTYFDHKDGITLKKAWFIDNKYSPFWQSFFQENIINQQLCYTNKNCINTPESTTCNNCVKIFGFGSNLLTHSLKYKTQFKTALLPNELKELYHLIGKKVFTWGCSLNIPTIVS